MQPTRIQQLFLMTGAVLGWFAVFFQLYLIVLNRVDSVPVTLIRFISFFTILTNIIAAVYYTVLAIRPASSAGQFLAKAQTGTAIALYIFIVGLVYNAVLRFQWAPQGMQRVVDEMLHLIAPVYFIVYWMMFVKSNTVQWKHIPGWLIFPCVYCLYILLRGSLSQDYPYPFMNVVQLGYPAVFLNCAFVCLAFLAGALLFVGVSKFAKS